MQKYIIRLNLTMSSLASFLFSAAGLVFLSVSGSWKLKYQCKKVSTRVGIEEKNQPIQLQKMGDKLWRSLFSMHFFCRSYLVCWGMIDTAWPNKKKFTGLWGSKFCSYKVMIGLSKLKLFSTCLELFLFIISMFWWILSSSWLAFVPYNFCQLLMKQL